MEVMCAVCDSKNGEDKKVRLVIVGKGVGVGMQVGWKTRGGAKSDSALFLNDAFTL